MVNFIKLLIGAAFDVSGVNEVFGYSDVIDSLKQELLLIERFKDVVNFLPEIGR